jgi:hypothetical protein
VISLCNSAIHGAALSRTDASRVIDTVLPFLGFYVEWVRGIDGRDHVR